MSYTPPYGPMDLEQHIVHATKFHVQDRLPPLDLAFNGLWGALIAGVADGVANWMIQRDEHMTKYLAERLSDMPSELLERASVALAEAAIVAQKAGR